MSNSHTPPYLPIVYHPDYLMDIGAHVFRTEKYGLALDILRKEGYAPGAAVQPPRPATREELARVHTDVFISDMEGLKWTPRTMQSELPISREIVDGFTLMAGGTILAARLAMEHGVAQHIGGGFHHAFADHAEGFCYINDIAVGIEALRAEGNIKRAAVIDTDLHQGNGTAHIYRDDAAVFTFSIHQEHLYPEKQRSNIDIGLDGGTGDEAYLERLSQVVPAALTEHNPDLVVYVAGADPFEEDQLGDLRLSFDGLRRRDRLVAEACRANGWRLAAVYAGGYAPDENDTARIHAGTGIELAQAWGIEPRV